MHDIIYFSKQVIFFTEIFNHASGLPVHHK